MGWTKRGTLRGLYVVGARSKFLSLAQYRVLLLFKIEYWSHTSAVYTHFRLGRAALSIYSTNGLEHMIIFTHLGPTRGHSYVYGAANDHAMTPTKRFHIASVVFFTQGMTPHQVNAAGRDDSQRYIKPLLLIRLSFLLLPYHL